MKNRVILDEKVICDEYQNGRDGVEVLCKKYHVGKIRIKEILKRNNIGIKRRGKQELNEEFVVSDWKIEKYPKLENGFYVAVDKESGFTTKDYMNNGGVLTTHIRTAYNVDTPTLYDRRMYYMRTGNYWWEQWFDIKVMNNVSNEKTKKVIDTEKIWGYLRESKEMAKKDGNDPTTGLCRTGLEEYLSVIFPNVNDWIHDKCIGILNGEKCKYRPDYRSESLKMIVEMDGLPHYTSPQNVINDEIKTKRYEADGYKVIRIPYFIQLTNDVIKQLFGVEVKEKMFDEKYASMGIKNKNTPAFVCPLGLKRMAKEFKCFPTQYKINVDSLLKENDVLLTGVDMLQKEYNKLQNNTIKVTEKLVSDIIDKHLWCFPHKQKPDYIIVSKKDRFNNAKATTIGPIDGEYGISINIKDYDFENIDVLTAVVLHEMVHFNLLLNGKQSKENIHDKIFNDLAKDIEKKTHVKYIAITDDNKIEFFVRDKHKYINVMLFIKDGIKYVTTLPKNKVKYWKKYLKEYGSFFETYKLFKSNRSIYKQMPVSKGYNLEAVPLLDEDYDILMNE